MTLRDDIEQKAEGAAALLRALANPQRLRLACELTSGERGVAELETLTGIRQPSLSKELGKLREAGIIEGRRESKAVFYSLVDPRVAAILEALCHPEETAKTRPALSPSPQRLRGGSVFARIIA
ncbi:MAG: metalloregulator ArsR/SmtB family transcription factor [Parvularcula sp.]|jgi:DNA-binding transcriptional ArsR family regulator|nr:metalloregulator ArsR/SmtB family transcription factor [Parvularcula sp.]